MFALLVEVIGEIEKCDDLSQRDDYMVLALKLKEFRDLVLMIDITTFSKLLINYESLINIKQTQYSDQLKKPLSILLLEAFNLSVLQADFESLLLSANVLAYLLSNKTIKEPEMINDVESYTNKLENSILQRINEYFLSYPDLELNISCPERFTNLRMLIELSYHKSKEVWFKIGLNRFIKKLKKKYYGDSYADITDQIKIYSYDAPNRSFVVDVIRYFESILNY